MEFGYSEAFPTPRLRSGHCAGDPLRHQRTGPKFAASPTSALPAHSYPSEQPPDLEAFHASEIPFVFGLAGTDAALPTNWPKPPDTPAERALSKAIMDYWTTFARTGAPSSDGAPAWKPFADGESYMEFRDTPLASVHLLPVMYALTEELIHRRRVAGTQYWFTNIGLASPPVPASTDSK